MVINIIPVPRVPKLFIYGFIIVVVLSFLNGLLFVHNPLLSLFFNILIFGFSIIVLIMIRDRRVQIGALIGSIIGFLFSLIFIFPSEGNYLNYLFFLHILISRIYTFAFFGSLVVYFISFIKNKNMDFGF